MSRTKSHDPDDAAAFGSWLTGQFTDRGYDFSRQGGGRPRLADELGVTGATVSRILAGQVMPELDTMIALSRVLDMDLTTILKHAGKMTNQEFPSDAREIAHRAVSSRELTPDEAMDAWGIHDPDERAFLDLVIRRARRDRDHNDGRKRHNLGGEGSTGR